MKKGRAVVLASALLLYGGAAGTSNHASLVSPDGAVRVEISTEGGAPGRGLVFGVLFRGKTVVARSPLGVRLNGGKSFSDGFRILGVRRNGIDETYSMPHGKCSRVRNRCNEAVLMLRNASGARMDITFRAYDDGAAFRYGFPDPASVGPIEITGELSGFDFPDGSRYWGLHLNSFHTPYEKEYTAGAISSIPDSSLIGLPMLVRTPDGVWTGITEAALVDYAGLFLKRDPAEANLLLAGLAPLADGSGVCVRTLAPRVTPWRVLILGDHPGRLIESNLVLNLNDPCAIDTSWVRPGTAINDWTSDHFVKGTGFKGAMDNRTMMHYIDFCGDYGLTYMSIDAGWYGADYMKPDLDVTRPIPEIDVPMLVKYAAGRNVNVFLWTFGPLMRRQLDRALDRMSEWGVKGLNIDFIESDDQETVNFVNRAVREAAAHRLHIEFHGVYKPTGISRTYPNLLAHEAVLGLEYAKWDTKPTPAHDCTLPFMRMLAGPLDYIPVGFSNGTRETYKIIPDTFMTLGTRCHELALLVVFESGFQVLADSPDNYRGKTGDDFFRHVPAAWSETRVLDGDVGEFIVLARKHRSRPEWFLGAITNWTARAVRVPLGFLGRGAYTAEIYADGPAAETDARDAVFETRPVLATDTLTVRMAPGGGQAVRFYRNKR
jgi:alpha-glucosidase